MAISPDLLPKHPNDEIEYPTGDGEPMAETTTHLHLGYYCIFALQTYFAEDPETLVAGNNFLYYEEGVPSQVVSPDCYVVFGVGNEDRDLYKVWEEGWQTPAVVIELTSSSTRQQDIGEKFECYEQRLRVSEYFLFDPTGDYLKPRLRGYRLIEGKYRPIPLQGDRLYSEQLRLELVMLDDTMRLFNPVAGEWLESPQETWRRAKEDRQRAEEEKRRADTENRARVEAEAKVAQLMAELETLRGKL